MAECLKEISLQALWHCEITEQEEEEYINDQVVPLNRMVRESYLKYLKQVLAKNLNMCSDTSNIYAQHDIEKCAGLLELKAFRLCMVTSLYQKAMLQMVADIKWHTRTSKMYHKFEEIMSENCICKVSKCKATQTDLEVKLEDSGNNIKNSVNIKTEVADETETNNFSSDCDDTLCPTSYSISSNKDLNDPCVTQDIAMTNAFSPNHSINELEISEKIDNCSVINEYQRDDMKNCEDGKGVQQNGDKTLLDCSTQKKTKDSLDKTNFNENFNANNISPLQKSNIGTGADEEDMKQLKWFLTDDNSKSEFGEAFLYETATQELIRILESEGELSEEDASNNKTKKDTLPQTCKNKSIDPFWVTQRHLQKKKLHESISKMCCDPDAKVKLKNKFFDLFGYDSEEDDVWCSKEEIAQYKQRIARTVVKHLLPYYKQKRILSRHVFKRVASHITDKLVRFKHFPGTKNDLKMQIYLASYIDKMCEKLRTSMNVVVSSLNKCAILLNINCIGKILLSTA